MYPMHSQSAVIKLAIPCGDIISPPRRFHPPSLRKPNPFCCESGGGEKGCISIEATSWIRWTRTESMNFSDRDRLFFLSSIGRGGGNRRGGVVHASAPHDAWLTRVARDPLCREEEWTKRDGKGINGGQRGYIPLPFLHFSRIFYLSRERGGQLLFLFLFLFREKKRKKKKKGERRRRRSVRINGGPWGYGDCNNIDQEGRNP